MFYFVFVCFNDSSQNDTHILYINTKTRTRTHTHTYEPIRKIQSKHETKPKKYERINKSIQLNCDSFASEKIARNDAKAHITSE